MSNSRTAWRRAGRGLLRALGIAVLAALLIVGGYWLWYRKLRGQPQEVERAILEGLDYRRIVIAAPAPVVIHRVNISLDAPRLRFLVTPPEPIEGHMLRGQTVGAFLERYDLQLAINGDYFLPWYSNTPWDYYPQVGEPVDPLGFAASNGKVYAQGKAGGATLFISCTNKPTFERPADLCHAVSGNPLLRAGTPVAKDDAQTDRHPRTAVGLDKAETKLIIVVIDGRQPGYSEGVSLHDLGDQMLASGAWDAINLDGGGSSALVVEGADGEAEVLSSPIHTRIVGRQRPVANHLGVALR